jgi:hypothetical protein
LKRAVGAAGVFALCALAAGCGGDDPPPPPQPGEVVLGTAATDGSGFLTLADDVTMVAGAQGGFHVWMKYRLKGMSGLEVHVQQTARRQRDNVLVSIGQRQVDVGAPGADGFWETPLATPIFLCPTPIGIVVADEPLNFQVEITTADGEALGTGQARAVPHCPADQSTFCNNICRG